MNAVLSEHCTVVIVNRDCLREAVRVFTDMRWLWRTAIYTAAHMRFPPTSLQMRMPHAAAGKSPLRAFPYSTFDLLHCDALNFIYIIIQDNIVIREGYLGGEKAK